MTGCSFRARRRYGGARELKALVEACHARGLAVLLDVVYNHFGPEGNYLARCRAHFFTQRPHPVGCCDQFRRKPRRCATS